jgi:hypothetical protein
MQTYFTQIVYNILKFRAFELKTPGLAHVAYRGRQLQSGQHK